MQYPPVPLCAFRSIQGANYADVSEWISIVRFACLDHSTYFSCTTIFSMNNSSNPGVNSVMWCSVSPWL